MKKSDQIQKIEHEEVTIGMVGAGVSAYQDFLNGEHHDKWANMVSKVYASMQTERLNADSRKR